MGAVPRGPVLGFWVYHLSIAHLSRVGAASRAGQDSFLHFVLRFEGIES